MLNVIIEEKMETSWRDYALAGEKTSKMRRRGTQSKKEKRKRKHKKREYP